MYPQNQILKNLPLKKRRIYTIDPPIANEESVKTYPQEIKQFSSSDNSLQNQIPLSSYMELLRQQYISNLQEQNYLHSSPFDYLLVQKVLAEKFLDHYRVLASQENCSRMKPDVDEHSPHQCLTPDDSSINQTFVDSIEEHFARSLAKFSSLNPEKPSIMNSQITESVVDEHFAKALGSTTWEKLKEKV